MYKEIHNLLKIENDKTTIFTNKELKMIDDYIKELESYKYNMDRDYLRLEKENLKLKKQLEEYKRLGFEHLNDKCNKLENQQKEFIDYLESYLKLFDNKDIYEEGSYDTIE